MSGIYSEIVFDFGINGILLGLTLEKSISIIYKFANKLMLYE